MKLNKVFLIILLSCFLYLTASAQSEIISISNNIKSQEISKYVHQSLSIPSQYSSESGLHIGYFDGEARWSLRIQNIDKVPLTRYFYLKPLNGAIDVRENPDGAIVSRFGTSYPKNIQSSEFNHSSLRIQLQPGETKDYYFSIRSRHSINISIWIASTEEILTMEKIDEHIFIFYLGIALGIILYNFLIFLSISDKTYLWYILFSVSFSLKIFLLKGFGDLYLDFLNVSLSKYLLTISGLSIITSTWFAFYLLEIHKNFKSHFPIFKVISILSVILILIDWTSFHDQHPSWIGPFSDLFSLFTEFYLFSLALRSISKTPMAKFYLLSWSFVLVIISIWYLMALDLLPSSESYWNVLLVSSLGQLVTLSLALGYRVKIAELEKTRSDLKARDKMKYQRLVRVLSHDIGNSLTNVQLLLHLMQRDRLSNYPIEKIWPRVEKLQKTARNMENILKHVRFEESARFDEENLRHSKITMRDVFQSCQEIFESKLSQKNIRLVFSGNLDLKIFGESSVFVNNILANILSNAIKFSNTGSEIQLTANSDGCLAILEIHDHGVGMSSDQIASLFKDRLGSTLKGTENEEGSGLGLQIMQDYVKKMNGDIHVESIPGKGTLIRLQFPIAQD